MMEDHIAIERYALDLCSPLLLTSKQTLRLGQLMKAHMGDESYTLD